MSHINIQGRDDLVRDTNSGAVLNTNRDALTAYKMRQSYENLTDRKINDLTTETNQIKSDLQEIKELLVNLTKSKDVN
tara:strand:+ start:45 stop:278 length:234 start_codon:yes stop_codon:yes gene_type:complete